MFTLLMKLVFFIIVNFYVRNKVYLVTSKYLLKPKPTLLNLTNQLNIHSNEQNNENNQNMLDCKQENIEDF